MAGMLSYKLSSLNILYIK